MTQTNNNDIPEYSREETTERWAEPAYAPMPTRETQQPREQLSARARIIRTLLIIIGLAVVLPLIVPAIIGLAGIFQAAILSVPLPALVFIIAGILFGKK